MNLREKLRYVRDVAVAHHHGKAGATGKSFYGTPKDEMLHAQPATGSGKWFLIPPSWGGSSWAGPAEWAEELGCALWRLWRADHDGVPAPGGPHELIGRTVTNLTLLGEKFGGLHMETGFFVETWVYLPDPAELGMAIKVWVDDRPGWTLENAISDLGDIGEPVVEEFTTEYLGTGLKAAGHGKLHGTREERSTPAGHWAAVRYAFAVPDRDAIVTVRATDPGMDELPPEVVADLDEFVRSITLSYLDGRPFGPQRPPDPDPEPAQPDPAPAEATKT